ncbi:hypothetical protein [Calditerrivibrio nitroreducens]|uniref:Uncharacterized protein n=1 Tax=Calditerrivibrio nitroreducens (strain DSM 19672 / NBRC 101217 / Yu37-1) TaxID=768670 RepID=E4THB9_CALNY|nr:hypothetical protein [Calditerrivibrio nitroreducens]ADR19854.1 hypothetical protein Calni_1957 [Calditerrivibrio nitroreducens DSM 19672]
MPERIREKLLSLKKELIQEIQVCSDNESLSSIYYRRIGIQGKTLTYEIENIMSIELEPIFDYITQSYNSIERISMTLDNLKISAKEFYSKLDSMVSFTRAARDGIAVLRKVINLPKVISKAIIFAGLIADIKYLWDEHNFKHEKEKLIQEVDEFFNKVIESITYENFFETLIKLEQKAIEYQKNLQDQLKALQEYEQLELFFEKGIQEIEV